MLFNFIKKGGVFWLIFLYYFPDKFLKCASLGVCIGRRTTSSYTIGSSEYYWSLFIYLVFLIFVILFLINACIQDQKKE